MKLDGHIANKVFDHLSMIEGRIYERLRNKDELNYVDIIKKRNKFPKDILKSWKSAQTEWWYFTGHLQGKRKKYGFEFCLFKRSPYDFKLFIIPMSKLTTRDYLIAHCALTDLKKETFSFNSRRQVSDLKRKSEIYPIQDWYLQFKKDGFALQGSVDGKDINLELRPAKPLVPHFGGYSEKCPEPHLASYYFSYTRLKVKGKIVDRESKRKEVVKGQAWFDHEKIYMPRNFPIEGWDWFSIQLDDGTEIMFYNLRDKKGLITHNSRGTFVQKNGKHFTLNDGDVKLKKKGRWKSKATEITYPSGWNMKIPSLGLDLDILPLLKNQEVDAKYSTIITYWEGACKVVGKKKGKKISGKSYVELSGYDKRLITQFLLHLFR